MKARTWLLAAVALVAYGLIAYAMRPTTSGPPIPGSSVSASPRGSLAMARLWTHLGHEFQPWQQLPELLPADTGSTFVAVEPEPGYYTDKDVEALRQWVRQGHAVIWVSEDGCPLIPELDVEVLPKSQTKPIHDVVIEQDAGAGRARSAGTWHHVDFSADVQIADPSVGAPQVLYRTPTGETIGARYKLGRGIVVYWTAPEVWENQSIGRADNLRIPWDLLGGRDVLWDEFGHGKVAQSMLGTMFGGGRQLALILFCAALALYGWFGLVRFGTPRTDTGDGPRLGTDFRHALAWHLRQPKLRAYQLALLERAVVRRLAERLGMSADTPAALVEEQVAAYPDGELKRRYADWRTRVAAARAAGRLTRSVQTSTRFLLQWLNRSRP
jgi:hypothetical protein